MNKKLLIIEDDTSLQKAMESALSKEKRIDLFQAFDGEEGFEIAKIEKPDLIILDLMMPEKDGYRVLYDIKHNSKIKDTPVVILTVIDSKVSDLECETHGAEDYLIKSEFTINELVAKIKKHLKL
ncbi:response regulator [Patescibacteria group bacterium]|nr:response regulator [Patescibacteria group bacterium]